jgi:hypothetical protein
MSEAGAAVGSGQWVTGVWGALVAVGCAGARVGV